jgi:hypothetical protein
MSGVLGLLNLFVEVHPRVHAVDVGQAQPHTHHLFVMNMLLIVPPHTHHLYDMMIVIDRPPHTYHLYSVMKMLSIVQACPGRVL